MDTTENGPPAEPESTEENRPRLALTLFVSGASPRSAMAVTTIRELCERRMPGRYRLDVIDVYQQPTLVAHVNVIATPTLIKQDPTPVRVLVGDMSDERCLMSALGLEEEEARSVGLSPDDAGPADTRPPGSPAPAPGTADPAPQGLQPVAPTRHDEPAKERHGTS